MFSTLVQDELRDVVIAGRTGCSSIFFAAFVGPLERELNDALDAPRRARARRSPTCAAYTTRINATNFALANDDGSGGDYAHADVVLIGVSRVGKTPTCLYMALQYGVFAANYPLTEDDLETGRAAAAARGASRQAVRAHHQAGAAAADPQRAPPRQPLRLARARCSTSCARRTRCSRATRIPSLDTTECSIEEISSRILNTTGIERRLRP